MNLGKKVEVLVTQSCLTLCDPMDCRSPGSSVQGILQARLLEWVAISFSRGSSRPRDGRRFFHTAGRLFIHWATREALRNLEGEHEHSRHSRDPVSEHQGFLEPGKAGMKYLARKQGSNREG